MGYDRVTSRPSAQGIGGYPGGSEMSERRMGRSQQGKVLVGSGSAAERPQVNRGRDKGLESWVCSELRHFPEPLKAFMSLVETDGGNAGQEQLALPSILS